MASNTREVDVGGIRPVVLTKLPSIHGLFVRGSYPYLLTADDAGKELILRNVNPLEGGASIECAVEFDDDVFAVTGGQTSQQTAVLAVVTSEPSLTFAALTRDEPCELQTRHRPVGGGQTAMRVEHVTGDIYAVSTITVGAHKGLADKENTPDNDGDGRASSSTVRLVNGSSLREVCSIPAEEREDDVTMGDDDEQSGCTVEVSSLATFDLGDAGDSGIVYLCVGSCVVAGPARPPEIDEAEPSKGFVKVYRIDPTASLLGGADAKVCERVTMIEVTGVPYQMAAMVDEGSKKPFLLCTVNNVVEVYAVEQEPEGGLRLGIVTNRHLHIASIFMQIQGNNVAVGDMTRGVTLLQFDPKSSSLSELARYEFSLWPTALQFLSNGKILVADDRFNIFLMERQREIGKGHSGSSGYSLQTVGQLHLGLLVNCIRPGSLRSTTTNLNRSDEEGDQFLLCTIEGALVSLKSIENSAVERMLQIQHAIQVNIQKQ
ncbi:DNA damage-binding protein 1a, partial [Perkinsus olseni]